ncbi:SRPBCC family protein [Mucilaginibacter antarcticus]|uniref:SRPBCC family protein n=1 Tax=Mucilaginibacter antarcticus TaxID=1855725 RepID=A0ABW5XSK1_9SPHI
MATFQGKTTINRTITDIYAFLSDFNNHKQLMPDNIQNWTSTYNEAGFGIQNMVQLSLQIVERIENSAVKIVATGNPPFPVKLLWDLRSADAGTEVTFTIDAELNMMMKMMASTPLQKLANHEVERLAAVLS